VADKTIYLNVRLSPTEAELLKVLTEAGKSSVSDTIRSLLKSRSAEVQTNPPAQATSENEAWEAFTNLCGVHPNVPPGKLLRLVIRVGILQLKKHPELVEKKLGL
jgi:hypothetical protein